MNTKKLHKVSPYLGEMFQAMKDAQKASECDVFCGCFSGFEKLAYVKMIEELGLITAEWISVEVDEKQENAPCEFHLHFIVNKGRLKRLKYDDAMEICWGTDWREARARS